MFPLLDLITMHFGLAMLWPSLAWRSTSGTLRLGLLGVIIVAMDGSALLLDWGVRAADRPMRIAGLGLITITTLKLFLVDAAILHRLLRIASFLGLGVALIAIDWAYGGFLNPGGATAVPAISG